MASVTERTRHVDAAPDLDAEALAGRLAQTLGSLSAYRLVQRVAAPRNGVGSWTLRAVGFTLALTATCALGAVLTHEPRISLALQLWAAVLLLTVLIAFDRLARSLLEILRSDVLPGLPAAMLQSADERLRTTRLLRLEPVASASIGALTVLLLAPGLYLLEGIVAPFTYAVVLVGSAVMVSMIYIPATVTAALLHFTSQPLPLPPVRPEEAPLVEAWTRITYRVTWVAALVATIGVLGPYLVLGVGPAATVVAVLVFAGATTAVLALIVMQQIRIRMLLSDHRETILRQIQAELTDYYARRHELNEAEVARVELLTRFQELARPSEGPGRFIGALIRHLAPMAIPLVSLLANTIDLPFIDDEMMVFLLLEKLLDVF